MPDRFYTNSRLAPGPIALQGAEVHHLATVLRAKPGDCVVLFNGDGNQYPAEIAAIDRKSAAFQVLGVEHPDRELPFRLCVAAPLPKGERGDFMIEKLTELGVCEFTPLRTERSVVHPRETKLERLARTVIEASKQCGRNVLMRIHELTDWSALCTRADLPVTRLLAHPAGAPPVPALGLKMDVVLAVGPEGGFTDSEVQQARSTGWVTVSLGPRILRVETAALALVCTVVGGR